MSTAVIFSVNGRPVDPEEYARHANSALAQGDVERKALLDRLAETCGDHELCADCDWHGSATPLCDSCADAGVPIDKPITCAADPLHRHCPSCHAECGACQRVATAEDAADITTDGRRP